MIRSDDLDLRLVQEAKKIAAGPLGREISKFPLRFAVAALFGQRPTSKCVSDVRNGTVCLVDLGCGPIAITCSHVLEEYKRKLEKNEQTIFQIGDLEVEPLKKLIDESKALDLATINLNGENLEKIANGEEIGACFFRPVRWPPNEIKEGDFVAFGGFPGRWRQQPVRGEIVFASFSIGACRVASVMEDHIVCQFEREYWVSSMNTRPGEELRDLGGLSGAPVFILRDLYWELIGIVYEFSPEFDLMYARPTKFLKEDGTIIKE